MRRDSLVITGVGPVSAAGIGREAFRRGMQRDDSLARPVSLFSTEGLPCSHAAEVTGLDLAELLESEKTYLDRCSEFALGATALAIRDAGLQIDEVNSPRVGLCLGSMYGCLGTMRTFFDRIVAKGAKFANSLLFSHSYVNSPISLVAIEFGIRGFHCTHTNGLTSGSTALVQACDAIRDGQADVILAGGVDALCETLFRALCEAQLLAPDDGGDGWLLGEGAGVIALETEQHAADRSATVLGRVAGAGMANDLDGTGDGLRSSMQSALDEAGTQPDEVSALYTAADGNATVDQPEVAALAGIFGDAVPERHDLKSRLGESLAAGGPLSAIAALASLAEGEAALINSMDPGGGCVSLVVQGAGGAQAS